MHASTRMHLRPGLVAGTKSTSKGGACTKWQDCASMCCSNGAGQSCTSSSGKCCDHDGLGTATSCKKGGSAPVSTGKGQRQTPDQCLSSKADWKGYTCARAKRERYCQHRKWGADVRECERGSLFARISRSMPTANADGVARSEKACQRV